MKIKKTLFAVFFITVLVCAPTAFGAYGESIRIAFLDSGVSVKHLNSEQIEEGENFVFPSRNTDDRIGHGTATAGIVLGSDEMGIKGLCPDAVIVPLVCFDTYPTGVEVPGDTSKMAEAIRAAVDRYDCDIINISMGTTEDSDELRSATDYAVEKGVLVVSAVGNDNITSPSAVYYPAAYDGVIGVGAADGDTVAAFSQRNCADVLAPGVDIKTVTRRNDAKAELRCGTSYACAYISGICAAIWSRYPSWTSESVYTALMASAREIDGAGDDGLGVVSAEDGLQIRMFRDIETHWAKESIEFCTERGIFRGSDDLCFLPDEKVSRAEFITALYRMAGEPETNTTAEFADAETDAWYSAAVAWAVSESITDGYDDAKFGTWDPVTREQAAVFLYRFEDGREEIGIGTDCIDAEDIGEISGYALGAVCNAVKTGVIQGINGRIEPNWECTRAQLAQMLRNCITAE